MSWSIPENQREKFNEWKKNLNPPLGTYDGASGGRFSYIETPTSLGMCYSVRDNMAEDKSNNEINVTDFSDW